MAKYNTKKMYNKKIPDGGANYNSAPFIVLVLDRGLGSDSVGEMSGSTFIKDTAIVNENVVATATLEIEDSSISTSDVVSIVMNVNVIDSGLSKEFLSVQVNLNISDLGLGQEKIDTVGAFFVVDSNNILQPLGVFITNDSRHELLPATRDSVEELPGRHGEIDFGTEFKAKMMELDVVTNEGNTPLQKSHLQRLFARYLDPTKGYKTLIFSDDVEKTYNVKYSGKIDIKNHATWLRFTLPFKMADPFIIGSFEKIITGTGVMVNDGTHETGLIIEIEGPAIAPYLLIDGEALSYDGDIPNGKTLVIDTELETAKIGNINALGDYNEVFPLLYPGESVVSAADNITIRWKDKWI